MLRHHEPGVTAGPVAFDFEAGVDAQFQFGDVGHDPDKTPAVPQQPQPGKTLPGLGMHSRNRFPFRPFRRPLREPAVDADATSSRASGMARFLLHLPWLGPSPDRARDAALWRADSWNSTS